MTGVLKGIQVIDFGQYIAGPLTAMFLADQGAEVIHIDPPGGPRWDTPANATWNRGKRVYTLDLKQGTDRRIAHDLIASADIVVENFRPGVMDRLRLGAVAMTALNPRLIYCSLPGFASDDPRGALPGWEGAIGAATDSYHQPDGVPVFNPVPAASVYAAFLAATSVAMALNARSRDGRGQRIEVPLFDAMLQAAGGRLTRFLDRKDAPPIPSPWGRGYQAGDGRWIHFSANDTRARQRALAAVGVSVPEAYLDREQLRTDPTLVSEVIGYLERLFLTRSAQEWEDLMNRPDAGAGCSVCRDSSEWLVHPHAHASGMIVEVRDPQYGRMLQPGVQVHLSRTPGEVHPRQLTATDAEPLRRTIVSHTSSSPSRESEPVLHSALQGVKVLDLCIVLAGPTCGRTLAEFGADVIKINDPRSEYRTGHEDVNRGKRHMFLDLKQPEGREIFWRLAEDADVVVQNFRQGAMDALGLGYEQVRQRRPDMIYVSLNTFGSAGPWASRRGWEEIAQAATGMQRRYGGEGRPAIQRYPVNDYGTGIMGAYGVALALLERQRTGLGQHVSTGLAFTACALQSAFMQAFDGKQWDEPRGTQVRGLGPLQRFYRASDRWLFIGARDTQLARLATVTGIDGIASLDGTALIDALEQRIATAPAAEWVTRLAAVDIVAQPIVSAAALMDDPWLQAHGLSITREHEGLGRVTTLGPAPRLTRTPVRAGMPAAKPGANTHEILREIGRHAEYDRLMQHHIIAADFFPVGEMQPEA